MDNERLNALLKQVQTELEGATTVDEQGRESLRALARDIQAVLDRPAGGQATADSPLIARLEGAVIQFEVTHPLLTQALSQLLTGLAESGV